MEQVFTNIELVTNICKFLNYEEQFKLSQVSSDLEYIIVNHVWNIKLHEVQIIMTQMSFVVSDTLKAYNDFHFRYLERDIWRRNSFILTSKNLDIFLNLNVKNIKKLHLIKYTVKCNSYESIKNVLPFRKKFPNLSELSCWDMEFENMDLQQIPENCEKLEILNLNSCSYLNGRFLNIGFGIDIQILKTMQNFNNFSISNCENTFSNIKYVINQLKFQQLTFEGTILNDSENINNDLNLSNLKYYKELNMPAFCNDSGFLYFQTNFLTHLGNLCNLSLSSEDYIFIEREFFNILLESCKSLTRLHLYRFTINDFIALPLLNELDLDFCVGLTYSHLKTILSEMNLKCFKSRWIEYKGNFECFPISQSLQKIDIKSDDNNLIKLLEFNEANLMNLTELTYNGGEKLRVSNFPKNLKVLNIEQGRLFVENCLKLHHLQELKLGGTITISDFLLLLKHENLKKLYSNISTYSADQKSLTFKEMKTFHHTNLRYLEMVWYKNEFLSDILLDLLNVNTKLSFACHLEDAMSLREILSHGKFPKRFKNINVCGASIDCNSIRNQCVVTMGQIKTLIESFKNVYFMPYFLLQ